MLGRAAKVQNQENVTEFKGGFKPSHTYPEIYRGEIKKYRRLKL